MAAPLASRGPRRGRALGPPKSAPIATGLTLSGAARHPLALGMDRMKAVAGLVAALGVCTLSVMPAGAQEISARDRQSASEAYTRGTAAYLAEDFADAGRWFETAHRLAPAAAALVQAVRSYERAGNSLRAATLALRLTALYPDDRAAQRAAESALRAAPQLVRIDVVCEGCAVQVDGTVMEHPSFFVEPGAEHIVEAAFATGTRRETVQAAAGERRSLELEAPPPPVETAEASPTEEPSPPTPPEAEEPSPAVPAASGGAPVPVWVSITALVATMAAGGVLIWSGIDTLDGVPAYEMNPTAEALADGQARELRTNLLIGGTGLLAATTLLLMIFTDWGGEPADAGGVQASFGIQGDGAMGALRGRF